MPGIGAVTLGCQKPPSPLGPPQDGVPPTKRRCWLYLIYTYSGQIQLLLTQKMSEIQRFSLVRSATSSFFLLFTNPAFSSKIYPERWGFNPCTGSKTPSLPKSSSHTLSAVKEYLGVQKPHKLLEGYGESTHK